MELGFSPAYAPVGNRRASPSGHRLKARTQPPGAARFRLFQVLRSLGLCRDRVEARLRNERFLGILRDQEHRQRIQEEQEFVDRRERQRVARLAVEQARARLLDSLKETRRQAHERADRVAEERKVARREAEQRAYGAMSPEEQAAWRRDAEIVAWLTSPEDAPSG